MEERREKQEGRGEGLGAVYSRSPSQGAARGSSDKAGNSGRWYSVLTWVS